jgi:hypothetical protein
LSAVADQFPDAVEAHGEAHAAQQSTTHRQYDDDVLRRDVKFQLLQVLK